jgi:hypothetical protein
VLCVGEVITCVPLVLLPGAPPLTGSDAGLTSCAEDWLPLDAEAGAAGAGSPGADAEACRLRAGGLMGLRGREPKCDDGCISGGPRGVW